MLSNWAFDSAAYRDLKPGPRALLWEVIRRNTGANNGKIVFSQREMQNAIRIADRETVAGYVRELENHGFLIARRRGGFNVKAANQRATEWELTMVKVGDNPPTKDFLRWQPDKIAGAENPLLEDGSPVRDASKRVRQRPKPAEKPSSIVSTRNDLRTENPSTYTFKAIGDERMH